MVGTRSLVNLLPRHWQQRMPKLVVSQARTWDGQKLSLSLALSSQAHLIHHCVWKSHCKWWLSFILNMQDGKEVYWAGETFQWEKQLTLKPSDLSSIPRIHVAGEDKLLQVELWPPQAWRSTHVHVHTQNWCNLLKSIFSLLKILYTQSSWQAFTASTKTE